MVQGANRDADARPLILSGQRGKPGHARDHERPIRAPARLPVAPRNWDTRPTVTFTPPVRAAVRTYDGTSRRSPFRLPAAASS
jgi:hypothetical protein